MKLIINWLYKDINGLIYLKRKKEIADQILKIEYKSKNKVRQYNSI